MMAPQYLTSIGITAFMALSLLLPTGCNSSRGAATDTADRAAGGGATQPAPGSLTTRPGDSNRQTAWSSAPPGPAPLAQSLEYSHGGIIRGPRDRKRLALIFTGGSFGEGLAGILDDLAQREVKASFFFTGEFISMPEHRPLIRRALAEGHYLGPHSDAHLLYCPWDDRERTLVGREQFRADLEKNLADLVELGARLEDMRYFVPPYEWYNRQIAAWSEEMGLKVISFTPGTRSNADYLPDNDPRFIASEDILGSILRYESDRPDGLNGFLLLLHVGAGPQRTDKMHRLLGRVLDELAGRGYGFCRVDELVTTPRSGAGTCSGAAGQQH